MAISPPSDIVLDVASAADPAKVRAATERLARLAADPTATTASFSDALSTAGSAKGSSTPSPAANIPAGLANARNAIGETGQKNQLQAYKKFEAVLLQNFVESMLPKDSELFGDDKSADIYRSMMAEQLANQLAKNDTLGIAKEIMAAHPPLHAQPATKTSES